MNSLTWFLVFTTAVFLVSTIWLGVSLDIAKHMKKHYKLTNEVLRKEHSKLQNKYYDLRFELSWLVERDDE